MFSLIIKGKQEQYSIYSQICHDEHFQYALAWLCIIPSFLFFHWCFDDGDEVISFRCLDYE